MSSAKIQSIYTDGACSGNPGPGGWGVVINFSDGTLHELGGAAADTTNNRMELQAAIAALQFLAAYPQVEPIALYTDSEYVRNGITKWIAGWKKKGWKTSQGQPVLNRELWETLDQLNSRQVTWHYVRGHTGDIGNERCDTIARAFSLGQSIALKQQGWEKQEPDQPILTAITPEKIPSDTQKTNANLLERLQSNVKDSNHDFSDPTMTDSPIPPIVDSALEDIPREVRVAQLRNLIETLRIADEVAKESYLISSSELADLMDINASAVTSRGDNWVWRNWVVSRVRREGNQILWQLERVD
ncbi:ribonuclease HI [Leptolyngbya sp. 'hensonii']|nr:ribonuclease HI [Leptolyngbya sp. 'hensonii']OLP19877.1 ribonuclease HI [Leptolyngbya sp. 'hensonii']